jgi:hypothetical protein
MLPLNPTKGPYTLYYTGVGQRGFSAAQTVHAQTAADALQQYRSLTASDHFVTFIKRPDGQRVYPDELRALTRSKQLKAKASGGQ